jgi:mannitol/fructose-specific phosphotransferase system IIA component (Ntr-type)
MKEHEFQRAGLTDSDTIAELGKLMGADYVVSGHITRLKDKNLLLISIINVETMEQIAGNLPGIRPYRGSPQTPARHGGKACRLGTAAGRGCVVFHPRAGRTAPEHMEYDFDAIRSRIEKIRQHKKKQRLLEHLKQVSGPDIFRRNIVFGNEDEAIRYMSDLMIKNGYAGETFGDEVLSREHSYSTAYGNIAIPHSMRISARKTGMAILLNEKPVPWGQNMVNIVLLFAIEKESQNFFYDIFDNLITLLLEAPNAAKIIECETYNDFIKTIVDL